MFSSFLCFFFLLLSHPNPQRSLHHTFNVHYKSALLLPLTTFTAIFLETTAMTSLGVLAFTCVPLVIHLPATSSGNQSGLSKHKSGHVTSGLKTFHTTLLITFTAMTTACNELIICFLIRFLSPGLPEYKLRAQGSCLTHHGTQQEARHIVDSHSHIFWIN